MDPRKALELQAAKTLFEEGIDFGLTKKAITRIEDEVGEVLNTRLASHMQEDVLNKTELSPAEQQQITEEREMGYNLIRMEAYYKAMKEDQREGQALRLDGVFTAVQNYIKAQRSSDKERDVSPEEYKEFFNNSLKNTKTSEAFDDVIQKMQEWRAFIVTYSQSSEIFNDHERGSYNKIALGLGECVKALESTKKEMGFQETDEAVQEANEDEEYSKEDKNASEKVLDELAELTTKAQKKVDVSKIMEKYEKLGVELGVLFKRETDKLMEIMTKRENTKPQATYRLGLKAQIDELAKHYQKIQEMTPESVVQLSTEFNTFSANLVKALAANPAKSKPQSSISQLLDEIKHYMNKLLIGLHAPRFFKPTETSIMKRAEKLSSRLAAGEKDAKEIIEAKENIKKNYNDEPEPEPTRKSFRS